MRKIDVLLGLQWGDEGKGKGVDVLTPNYDVVVRFQGGPNAGHSLEFEGKKHILHLIPSGIFHPGKLNIIANGVVLDPVIFRREIEGLENSGIRPYETLKISRKAHLILPFHPLLDAVSEASKGEAKIGSTLKGIGPAYRDKIGRDGIRVGDIESGKIEEIYRNARAKYEHLLSNVKDTYDLEKREADFFASIEKLKQFEFIDSEYEINRLAYEDKKILAEGAQGAMLDIDFGSYPYVTSSNTICGGACTGMGVPPSMIGEVIGIVKAYCTRVGGGPFPTELTNEVGQRLREIGHEYGSTTGRPRRCGWLDLVALKYSVMLSGVTQIILTKADVLDSFDTIRVCTHYKVNNQNTDRVPFSIEELIEPVYVEFSGWKTIIRDIRKSDSLPENLLRFKSFIEKTIGVPITYVSTGPARDEIIRML
ncbi:MAG TPA: adenylosuccinate synthase [Salinivirgaceae bacterium]|nr:adenylosuccinate synthase [Salinivirgaceae bacterium]